VEDFEDNQNVKVRSVSTPYLFKIENSSRLKRDVQSLVNSFNYNMRMMDQSQEGQSQENDPAQLQQEIESKNEEKKEQSEADAVL